MLLDLMRWCLARLIHAYLRPLVRTGATVPTTGAAIVAANHPTVLDGVVLGLWAPRKIRFLVAGHLFRNPFMGWFFRWTRCIPVGRGKALDEAVEALKNGEMIGIFPEGDISGTQELSELRTGVARLALKTGAPVYPLGIAGTLGAFPPAARLLKPGAVVLDCGEPVHWNPRPDASEPEIQAILTYLKEQLSTRAQAAQAQLPQAPRPAFLPAIVAGLILVPMAYFLRLSEP